MSRARGIGVAHGAVTVLSGVDLTVAAGDRVAVVGPAARALRW